MYDSALFFASRVGRATLGVFSRCSSGEFVVLRCYSLLVWGEPAWACSLTSAGGGRCGSQQCETRM